MLLELVNKLASAAFYQMCSETNFLAKHPPISNNVLWCSSGQSQDTLGNWEKNQEILLPTCQCQK
jgi:hypothetical protein